MKTGHASVRTPEGNMLAYDVIGSGPPVILLHGGGQTRHSWAKTARTLANLGYRAICMDARGHGDSDWTDSYSLKLFSEDLKALITELGPGVQPAIIGASLGGLTAIVALGSSDPPPASALVLVDIAAKIKPGGASQIRDFMAANADGFATVDEAADAVSKYMTDRPRPKDVSGLRKNLREIDGRLYWHWDPSFILRRPSKESTEKGDAAYTRTSIDGPARRLELPVMLVRGEHSNVVDEDSIAHFRQLVPHVETQEVSGAGHMVAGDANTPFTETIIAFLSRHYPTKPEAK